MFTLYIDTSKKTETIISLYSKYKLIREIVKERDFASQIILPSIEKIIHEEKISWNDISEIKVNKGPGSFTGIRVGVTVANMLGFLLNISINNGETLPVLPIY